MQVDAIAPATSIHRPARAQSQGFPPFREYGDFLSPHNARVPASTPIAAALPARPKFEALQSGRDIEADLALHAQWLQRDRIVGATDQHVAADADPDRRAALGAGIIAGEIAGSQSGDRRIHAPGQRRFPGDAKIDADLADGGDVAVVRHAIDPKHATEIGDGTDHETDAGAAAAFEHADLDPLDRLLRMGAGK